MLGLFPLQQLSDEILQKIAKEMNLSETAFILEKNDQETYSKGQGTHPLSPNTNMQILITSLDTFEKMLITEDNIY